MKGYLQRIASQAAKPSGNIAQLHPIVGSISAPPKHEIPDEGIQEDTINTLAGRPELAQNPAQDMIESPRGASSLEQRKATAASQSPESALERTGREESVHTAPFKPLLGTNENDTPGIVVRDAAPILPPIDENQPRGRRKETERFPAGPPKKVSLRDDSKSKGDEKTPSNAFLPLPTPLAAPIVESPLPHAQTEHLATTRGRTQSQFAGPSKPAPREADEVQIHIGRIELTAVPQTPQRPVAPARKSINLDEYLKRRNQRNG